MNKRVYHRWTEEESTRLYKFVLRCDRNWTMVQNQFPQFTMLQLQNKFLVMQKQMQSQKQKNTKVERANSAYSAENTDTLQQLMNILSAKSQ
ncbi:Homeobox-like_domain superfamily [Hexamita inflata]|uniref:Homeobox-like domain superfamily n=1 Tax=Hexamita inflata TaxID=28002 RepID=A0AA86USQ7_9EUKA|nr:Homeobox-like domain superfamily [Hexamita inflata]CAI9959683.1 Homeobox-like domain superfamily [Hexamita inflata]